MTDQLERVDDMDALVKRIISSSYSEGYYYQQNARVRAILVTALADAERRVREEVAKVCEVEALIDDERGYYGKEMAKAIRAKAIE